MTEYRTPLRDMKFVINDPADGNGELALPGFEELTPDLAGIDQTVLRGKAPRTLHLTADHKRRKKAADCKPIAYPEPDGELTFSQSSSVLLSNTNHEESQPCHLTLKDATIAVAVNLAEFDAPEQRYCPADVCEFERQADGSSPRLRINAITARTARPATSEIRLRTSSGSRRRAAKVQFIPICKEESHDGRKPAWVRDGGGCPGQGGAPGAQSVHWP
jgi:hypothetical protein